jgi:hypothetical protein
MSGGHIEVMKTEQKIAIAGAGMVVVGFGLGVLGAMLVVPAVVVWTAGVIEKRADRLLGHAERASRTVGTVAGTLHRSFSEAAKVGVAEIRKGSGARDRAV